MCTFNSFVSLELQITKFVITPEADIDDKKKEIKLFSLFDVLVAQGNRVPNLTEQIVNVESSIQINNSCMNYST